MEDIITLVKEFEGIIGALLGVIVTMILNEYMKSKGKIKFYFDQFKFRIIGSDEYGGGIELDGTEECRYIEYEFVMQIYNSSESKKILRNIQIEFYDRNNLIYKTTPLDQGTNRRYAGGYKSDELRIININSKEILEINIEGRIYKEEIDLEMLSKFNKVLLRVKDNKDKEMKKVIYNS